MDHMHIAPDQGGMHFPGLRVSGSWVLHKGTIPDGTYISCAFQVHDAQASRSSVRTQSNMGQASHALPRFKLLSSCLPCEQMVPGGLCISCFCTSMLLKFLVAPHEQSGGLCNSCTSHFQVPQALRCFLKAQSQVSLAPISLGVGCVLTSGCFTLSRYVPSRISRRPCW